MEVEYSARSHVGKVREKNQDNFFIDGIILSPQTYDYSYELDGCASLPTVFAVCDGLGGEENGEVASLIAVQTLLKVYDLLKLTEIDNLLKTVQAYVDNVNEAIHSTPGEACKRIGTTIALVIASKNGINCYNIGDSRVYIYKKTKFRQITNDHTLAAKQNKNNPNTQNKVDSIYKGNNILNIKKVLTRCIGIGNESTIENYPTLFGKCRILVCTDGLTDMVKVNEIKSVLRTSSRTAIAADSLIRLALNKGGIDNITLIIIDIKNTKKPFFGKFRNKRKSKKLL